MAKIQSELQAAHESVAEVKKRIEPPETPHITKKHNGTAAREDRPKLPGHWEQIRRRHHEATGSPSPTMRVHNAQQSDQGNEQVNDVEMEEDLAEAIAGTQGDTEETDGGNPKDNDRQTSVSQASYRKGCRQHRSDECESEINIPEAQSTGGLEERRRARLGYHK
ncbi:hypothetical protein GN958_ATG22466 [Phytophthora infestans]|uniref:Uncharacterized protein n=1 Tax=Phytophthora infestans TaxID=4787 RepID=A0A8S9TQZ4_PHYIN|nr:hypothetical protein GN958_ATG22466 [Phytophthora infestans]